MVVSKMEIPTNNSYVSISVKCASEELLWHISYRIISGICQKKVDLANYNESLDLLKREKLHKNQCDFAKNCTKVSAICQDLKSFELYYAVVKYSSSTISY